MSYSILIQPPAERDVEDVFRWIARRSPERARVWREGVFQAVRTLADFPRRCSLAHENDDFDVEVRHLLYGDYRILFTIDSGTVRILHIRHGARRPLPPDEI